jgi:hypothetical protein
MLVNYFQNEIALVDFLKERVGNCKVMGVNDYWDVLHIAPNITASRLESSMGSVFVFYGGDTVTGDFNCERALQIWHIVVCSKNQCEIDSMAPARKENGEFVTFVIQAMREFAMKDIGRKVQRISPQNFPIAERLGIIMTALSYRIDAPF